MVFSMDLRDPLGLPDLDGIRAAAARIAAHVHRTPVLFSASLDELAGCSLRFKCENFQKVGAFKARGAHNAVFSLAEEEAVRGVATHSSGNHAAALALAARRRGIPAHIVMPSSAPAVKRAAVEGYGARIVDCEPTLQAREEGLARVLEETSAVFIHPYDDARVIAGQGTACLEFLAQAPDLEVLLVPVGGGGLASGTCLAGHGLKPHLQILGVEPTGADDAARSLQAGELIPSLSPQTIADGLLTSLSPRTFTALQAHLDDILCVDDEAILRAMRLLFERMKLVVEPSAAVVLAAVLGEGERFAGKRVGLILSGGNVNLDGLFAAGA